MVANRPNKEIGNEAGSSLTIIAPYRCSSAVAKLLASAPSTDGVFGLSLIFGRECMVDRLKVLPFELTKDQEQSIVTDLKQHITDLVNGVAPHGLRADHELGGGPPGI